MRTKMMSQNTLHTMIYLTLQAAVFSFNPSGNVIAPPIFTVKITTTEFQMVQIKLIALLLTLLENTIGK